MSPPSPQAMPRGATAAQVAADLRRLVRARLRVGTALAAVVIAGSAPVDLLVAPGPLGVLLSTRAVVVGLCVLLFLLAGRPAAERFGSALAVLHGLVLGCGVEAFVLVSGSAGSPYWPAFMVVIVSLGLLYPMRPGTMAAMGLLLTGVYLSTGLWHLSAELGSAFFVQVYFVAVTSVVAAIAAHFNWLLRHSEVSARLRLEQANEELRRAGEQLAQSAALSLLGSLSAGLAHEVRNPNHAILNSLPLVRAAVEGLGAGKTKADALELLAVMDDAARRVDGLVSELLAFSRPSAPQAPTRWRPADAVEASLKLLAQRTRSIAVKLDLTCNEDVEGLAPRLNQVVLNLLDNAFRAAPQGGQVEIRTSRVAEGVELVVEDDGPGVKPELLQKIFEPFFTTRSVGEGTGLGLHLALQIVRKHAGKLEVENRAEGGARFRLWVPLRCSLAPEAAGLGSSR